MGFVVAAVYAALLILLYRGGVFILGPNGAPLPSDFVPMYIAGTDAIHGDAASPYNPGLFGGQQDAFAEAHGSVFPHHYDWAYPPSAALPLSLAARLPYAAAFVTVETVALGLMLLVVVMIVRGPAGAALALASPLSLGNFGWGQDGFLTGALLGAALWLLERRPVLAGVAIGLLTYKPQFGLLFPPLLAAAGLWRPFVAATLTALLLLIATSALFGIGSWAAFLDALSDHGDRIYGSGADEAYWGKMQSIYGAVRAGQGGAALAWSAQGVVSLAVAVAVCLAWRRPGRHAVKAALVSAGALAVTPYQFAYDLAAIAIPVAFLVKDRADSGPRAGEIPVALLVGAGLFAVLVWNRSLPLGPALALALFGLALRRQGLAG